MRIRSKALWQYLHDTGALNGTAEDIARAKAEYRRIYKRTWKQGKRKKRELRPGFTEQEYTELCKRATLFNLPPTTYVRELVLAAQERPDLIPHRETLLYVLQRISMTVTALAALPNIPPDILRDLHEAESLLLDYLKR